MLRARCNSCTIKLPWHFYKNAIKYRQSRTSPLLSKPISEFLTVQSLDIAGSNSGETKTKPWILQCLWKVFSSCSNCWLNCSIGVWTRKASCTLLFWVLVAVNSTKIAVAFLFFLLSRVKAMILSSAWKDEGSTNVKNYRTSYTLVEEDSNILRGFLVSSSSDPQGKKQDGVRDRWNSRKSTSQPWRHLAAE